MKWNPVNDKIICASFYFRFVKNTVVQLHSPEHDADEKKDTFHEQLEKEIDAAPTHGLLTTLVHEIGAGR